MRVARDVGRTYRTDRTGTRARGLRRDSVFGRGNSSCCRPCRNPTSRINRASVANQLVIKHLSVSRGNPRRKLHSPLIDCLHQLNGDVDVVDCGDGDDDGGGGAAVAVQRNSISWVSYEEDVVQSFDPEYGEGVVAFLVDP